MFSKSGHSVTVSPSNELIGSSDAAVSVTTFIITGCRAWGTVSQDLRPRCVSLIDASRPDWYVRHAYYYLRVDPEYSTLSLPLFQQDSSFILHTDTVHPGYYSFESLNFPDHYIRLRDDGYLWIESEDHTTAYMDAASFTFHPPDTSRK